MSLFANGACTNGQTKQAENVAVEIDLGVSTSMNLTLGLLLTLKGLQ